MTLKAAEKGLDLWKVPEKEGEEVEEEAKEIVVGRWEIIIETVYI